MKKLLTLITIVLVFGLVTPVFADELVPTREFFEKAQVTDMRISPDGQHVAFTYEEGSEVKLAIMNLAESSITTSFGFGENQHVFSFWWGSDERVVMSVGEVTGNLDNLGPTGSSVCCQYRRQPPPADLCHGAIQLPGTAHPAR